MNSITKDVALKFCEICNRVYEDWITHKRLFEDEETRATVERIPAAFTNRLSIITQENCLSQIAKLHDPAIQGKSVNLTIDYMMRFGQWEDQEEKLQMIESTLNELWDRLRPARNKLLAHNDLEALMAEETLGAFPEGLDDHYFTALSEFVKEIHQKWHGSPYVFNDLARVDVDDFLGVIREH